MLKNKSTLRFIISITLFVLSLGLTVALPKIPILNLGSIISSVDNIFYDFNWKIYFKITDNSTLDTTGRDIKYDEDRIFIIDIDDKALKEMGSYNSWTRIPHTIVSDKLTQAGTAAIAFDILFKDADHGQKDANRVIQAVGAAHIPMTSSELAKAFDDDQALINIVQKNPNIIVNGTVGNSIKYNFESDLKELSSKERIQSVNNFSKVFLPNWRPSDTIQMQLLDDIFPELMKASHRFGVTNVIADQDGIHRKEPLLYGFPDPSFKYTKDEKRFFVTALSLQTSLHLMGLNPAQIKIVPGEYIELGKPLGIYRDSFGNLQSTYPGLSFPMLRDLYEKKSELLHWIDIQDTNQITQSMNVSQMIVIHKDSMGISSADILNGQLLPEAFLHKICTESILADTALIRQQGDKINLPLKDGYFLGWDPDEKLPMISSADAEYYSLDLKTLAILKENCSKIASLPPKSDLHLSGQITINLDPDKGKIHASYIILTDGVLKDFFKHSLNDFYKIKNDTLRLGPVVRIPVDQEGRMMIRFVGPYENQLNQRRSFQQVSYHAFVSGDQDNSLGTYQGKIAILGSTIAAMFDKTNTPFSKDYPGPLIHANLIQNILTQNFIEPVSKNQVFTILLVIALVAAISNVFFNPITTISITLFYLIAYYLFQYELFRRGFSIGVVEPYLCILISTVLGLFAKYTLEQRDKKQAVSIFKQYISPELIDQMLQSDEMPSLGGQKSHLTAYFTDIAGFSTFSEKIGDPVALVELLNVYLSAMTNILMEEKGTLDKYEGDAIIAFFGAPIPIENHAKSACLTALGMQEKLGELRVLWAREVDPKTGESKWPAIVHEMRMRIGINSGMIVTGNMGSEFRKNYTMMGDPVNLAARLESGAKQYGVFTMLSRETVLSAGEGLLTRKIDLIRVVGKSEAVEIHELLSTLEKATPELLELVEKFAVAHQLYTEQKWDEAILVFNECLVLEPHNPAHALGCKTCPSLVFIERCEDYKKHPPVPMGLIWDGVYTATDK